MHEKKKKKQVQAGSTSRLLLAGTHLMPLLNLEGRNRTWSGGDCLYFGKFFFPSKRKKGPFKGCTERYFQYENAKTEIFNQKGIKGKV